MSAACRASHSRAHPILSVNTCVTRHVHGDSWGCHIRKVNARHNQCPTPGPAPAGSSLDPSAAMNG